MKISQIMSKAIVIDDNTSVKEAAKIMSDKNIGSLIIVKDNKIAGIVTERDVLKNISKLNSKVSAIMSKNVITIEKEGNIEEAAEIMAEKKIKKLPVIEDKKLVGLISATDIIAHSKNLNEDFLFE